MSPGSYCWGLFQYPLACSGLARATKPISSVPLFSSIAQIYVSYWISHLYLKVVAAAHLRWHLPNMNVMQRIEQVLWRDRKNAYGEINGRSFSNPRPWLAWVWIGDPLMSVTLSSNGLWWLGYPVFPDGGPLGDTPHYIKRSLCRWIGSQYSILLLCSYWPVLPWFSCFVMYLSNGRTNKPSRISVS